MIINFSGCDGVGKSTISENCSKHIGASYTHFSAPKSKEAAKKEYFDFLATSNDKSKTYVCDRFYEGEWTYAPIYRKYIGDYAREIEDAIANIHNYLYVYVTAELDTIIHRTRVRGEDFAREEDFQTILDNYQDFLMDQRLPFTIINNGEGKDVKENSELALNDITTLQLIWSLSRSTAKVLPRGNVRAKYFIVGPNPDTNVNSNGVTLAMSRGEVAELVIKKLKARGIYLDCWFTTNENIAFEQSLIKPEQIIRWEDIVNDKV